MPVCFLQFSNSVRYNIYEVKDGKFGILENGEWNGMIGEVHRKVRVFQPLCEHTYYQETPSMIAMAVMLLLLRWL